MKKGKHIVTSFDYPPTPTRDADWSAVLGDYDPESDQPVGRGPTEIAAMADLLLQIEQAED